MVTEEELVSSAGSTDKILRLIHLLNKKFNTNIWNRVVGNADKFFDRANQLVSRLEALFGQTVSDQLENAVAWQWRKTRNGNYLQAIHEFDQIRLEDLLFIERQKKIIERNTKQFLAGLPANNVLLWGPRGTGKSSLIKALFNDYCERGLRLIEVEKSFLVDLPEIVTRLKNTKHQYIVFCDDLTFDENDSSYRVLKTILDGSLLSASNTLIYATSNRRHLLPEYTSENDGSEIINGELHYSEGVEEKISLSERFGIWLSFHSYRQNDYLDIVSHWILFFHPDTPKTELKEARQPALQWALERGSRSGRTAYQFARDWSGTKGLGEMKN